MLYLWLKKEKKRKETLLNRAMKILWVTIMEKIKIKKKNTLCDAIMMGSCHYRFVQIHRLHNRKSELQLDCLLPAL